MSNCKYCGLSRKNHCITGLCKDGDSFFDDGEEDKKDLKQRRERIATAALNGMLSNSALRASDPEEMAYAHKIGAANAVLFADALIKALDEVKE